MASVAHIVFSSTIGYGLMLAKYKKHKRPFLTLILFFLIAATMHGFYDFWLINKAVRKYEWLTTIFFIISIHIWHVYANNTLNITTFYNKEIVLQNDKLKYYVIFSLITILMFSWVVNGYEMGKNYDNKFLVNSIVYYGYFIFYLAFSMSRFEIIRGYFKPFKIPLSLMLPKVSKTKNFTNLKTTITASSLFFKDSYISIVRYTLGCDFTEIS